jgi:hypothetical protein
MYTQFYRGNLLKAPLLRPRKSFWNDKRADIMEIGYENDRWIKLTHGFVQ